MQTRTFRALLRAKVEPERAGQPSQSLPLRARGGPCGGTPWGRNTSGRGAQAAPIIQLRLFAQPGATVVFAGTQNTLDAASHGRAMRWGAMGQERQWQWSTGGSLCQNAYTGTHCPMAHRRGRAKPCFNQFFREQLPEIRNGDDAKTGRDAASERRTLRWDAMGQERQWQWSIDGSRHLIVIICTARCNSASSQARKTRLDEEATTGRDAASERRTLRWDAMGQERQWQWSTDGSCRLIVIICTARCKSASSQARQTRLVEDLRRCEPREGHAVGCHGAGAPVAVERSRLPSSECVHWHTRPDGALARASKTMFQLIFSRAVTFFCF